MPRYLIERDIPGAGQLSASELRATSQMSVGILRDIGPSVTWIHSYVLDDKIYCIYDAPDTELLYVHARCMNTPVIRISEVRAMIDPSTAEE